MASGWGSAKSGKILHDFEKSFLCPAQYASAAGADPIADAGFFKGDRTQSWGQIPKWLRDYLVSIGELPEPGDACNPSKANGEEE